MLHGIIDSSSYCCICITVFHSKSSEYANLVKKKNFAPYRVVLMYSDSDTLDYCRTANARQFSIRLRSVTFNV